MTIFKKINGYHTTTKRIKRDTLIGNVLQSGLSIVDIECKIKALKASWVPRLN